MFTDWNWPDISPLLIASGYSTSNRNKSGVRAQYQQLIDGFLKSGLLVDTPGGFTSEQSSHGFGIIRRSEFERIIQSKKDSDSISMCRINQAHTLLLLAYIRCNMIRMAGRPTFYSNLLSRLSINIGISTRSVSYAAVVLEQLGILHNEELPRYKDSAGWWHSNVRIFVDMNPPEKASGYDWAKETERGIAFILANQVE